VVEVRQSQPESVEPTVGVALSGGGHRAALFALGVLTYLADAGKNRQVTSIASVSGGSLTNGYLAQRMDFRALSGPQFEHKVRPLAAALASRGTVWAAWTTWAYLVLLALVLAGAIAGWFLDLALGWRTALFVAGLLVWAILAERRGWVCELAFSRALYSGPGVSPLLGKANSSVDHVICATDLHAGEHVYFSPGFVCAYRFGWGGPANLRLSTAVQCSAALPGAFPVRWLPTAQHRFEKGTNRSGRMALVDGGVYDNMADQWPLGVAERKDRWPYKASSLREPKQVIVANASAGMRWGSVAPLRIPLLGELLAVLRDKDVLYDNTTALRRRGLVGQFDRAMLTGEGPTGALVHIPQSPFDVPRAFEGSTTWPDRAVRAKAVLDHLSGESEQQWEKQAEASATIGTNLSALGVERSANLLRHAYLLAMSNLYVILGYPLVPVPSLTRFNDLVSTRPSSTTHGSFVAADAPK
jgi:predicted acylesterase/phospholipase RssA